MGDWFTSRRTPTPLRLTARLCSRIGGTDGLADVPGGAVPDQDPDRNVLLLQSGATPVQKLEGDRTHWTPLNKAQPDRLRCLVGVRQPSQTLGTQQDAIAGPLL
jgi:hypothetical protein